MRALCIPLVGDPFFHEVPVEWSTVLIIPEKHVTTCIDDVPGPIPFNTYYRNGAWARKDGSTICYVYEER